MPKLKLPYQINGTWPTWGEMTWKYWYKGKFRTAAVVGTDKRGKRPHAFLYIEKDYEVAWRFALWPAKRGKSVFYSFFIDPDDGEPRMLFVYVGYKKNNPQAAHLRYCLRRIRARDMTDIETKLETMPGILPPSPEPDLPSIDDPAAGEITPPIDDVTFET